MDVIARLRDRFYKPELDAGRAQRVYRDYDVGRRYGDYHALCPARFTGNSHYKAAPYSILQLMKSGTKTPWASWTG